MITVEHRVQELKQLLRTRYLLFNQCFLCFCFNAFVFTPSFSIVYCVSLAYFFCTPKHHVSIGLIFNLYVLICIADHIHLTSQFNYLVGPVNTFMCICVFLPDNC